MLLSSFKNKPFLLILIFTCSTYFRYFFPIYAVWHLSNKFCILMQTQYFIHVFSRFHGTDLYRTLGRVICHAYLLCGYWPVQFNRASLVAAMTSKVSSKLALDSFMETVFEREKNVLIALLDGKGRSEERVEVLGVLTRFDCRYLLYCT